MIIAVVVNRYISRPCCLFLALVSLYLRFVFFFSSRRRHTRCLSDWSSDVCSSDLRALARSSLALHRGQLVGAPAAKLIDPASRGQFLAQQAERAIVVQQGRRAGVVPGERGGELGRGRSEERRVGKECRYGWGRAQR